MAAGLLVPFRAMNLSPITRPVLVGRSLGFVPNSQSTYPEIDFQASSRMVGTRAGYASFEQALIGTMKSTLGEHNPAAAILKLDGRFYAQGVDMLTTTIDFPGQDKVAVEKLRFEGDSNFMAEVEPTDASVVAFVDGMSSLIFGNPTKG
jgi:hypothetical protein